ncbi:TatD family hydrolase [Paenibacillus antibioticophila]|uniref:TatD family hydrolase n=1 Tax=Paenibacillus antibioticophila TaxID=1274374 RepID=UPI0005CAEE56|nr:TatD family hydrolase [Paenibacillus antibioticophila]
MTYIDFHVHIDHFPEPVKIANQYENNKIYALFVTNLPELFEKHLNSFKNYKYVRLAIGYHPELTQEFPFKRELFERLVPMTNYIGEVGIDLSRGNKYTLNEQLDNFSFITQEKYNKGKIYSIHSKDAEDEVLEILVHNKVKQAVFHWYSGKLSTLEKIIKNNYLLSINLSMQKSKKGQKIISQIPEELLLFETDGPFIRFDGKLITPMIIPQIYSILENEINGFHTHVMRNFKRMLITREFEALENSR